MSVLTQGQREFRDRLAQKTGLNAGVLTAWMLAEQSSGAAKARQAQGNHNWLNIAYYDNGPGSITRGREWRSPSSAADATAAFLQGKKYGPSSGIRRIIRTAGQSPDAQIRAIAGSGWASSGYEGGSTLKSLFNSYGKGVSQPGKISVPSAPSGGAAPMAYRPSMPNSMLKSEPYTALINARLNQPSSSPQTPARTPQTASQGSVNYQSGTPVLRNPSIRNILGQISSVYGKPLTVGTTTNHSKYSTSGNVSDHYVGNGADIPASGAALTRLGQSALIALGVSPAEAKKSTGGLFNINRGGKRYQVIFNTNTGGNHYNHLHIGVK